MSVTQRIIDQVTVLDLEPVLTYVAGAELLATFRTPGNLRADWLLNMGNVSYIDSAGLGAVIAAFREVTREGGTLKVSGLQPRARHVFTISGLVNFIEIFDSDRAALKSFSSRQPARALVS
jgi:anti-sigma B factor antagonist